MKFHLPIIIILLCMICSCEKIEVPTFDNESNTNATAGPRLNIKAMADDGQDLQYPICVYALDSSGKCKATQQVNSKNENISLNLKPGKYTIIALSGIDEYNLPETLDAESQISMPSNKGYANTPLLTGESIITLDSDNANANITLSYQVASIDFSLENLPSTAKDVSITFNQQYTVFSLTGNYSTYAPVTIPLTKTNGIWSSGKVYVFPGAGAATSISISFKDGDEAYSYSYKYTKPLQQATPYVFTGTYSTGMIELQGSIVCNGWNDPVNIDFSFGPSGTTETTETDEDPKDDYQIPELCSAWRGHAVALYLDNTQKATEEKSEAQYLILLAKNEYQDVYSANSSDEGEEAFYNESHYTEGEYSGWEIPSSTLARMLMTRYASGTENFTKMNDLMSSLEGSQLSTTNRYLCGAATQTFSFKTGTVTNAGTSTRYNLRLVKALKIK